MVTCLFSSQFWLYFSGFISRNSDFISCYSDFFFFLLAIRIFSHNSFLLFTISILQDFIYLISFIAILTLFLKILTLFLWFYFSQFWIVSCNSELISLTLSLTILTLFLAILTLSLAIQNLFYRNSNCSSLTWFLANLIFLVLPQAPVMSWCFGPPRAPYRKPTHAQSIHKYSSDIFLPTRISSIIPCLSQPAVKLSVSATSPGHVALLSPSFSRENRVYNAVRENNIRTLTRSLHTSQQPTETWTSSDWRGICPI